MNTTHKVKVTHHELGKMGYPQLEISLSKIRHNAETLVGLCRRSGIRVAGVTKVACGHAAIARAMVAGGIDTIADARIENLKQLCDIPLPKMLLRLPMISQASEVVAYADISLNSELETIRALSAAANQMQRTHQVVLMFELGDLREGILDPAEAQRIVAETLSLERISLAGIGTNLTCLGGVIPTPANLTRLVEIKGMIERRFDIRLDVVSGGNSSSVHLVESAAMPVGINQLRLGEAIVMGRETAFGRQIGGTEADCFKLFAEIIEIKDKPSLPTGELGLDAYGNRPRLVDRGTRRRAICAIGRQDVAPESLFPEDEAMVILGASSDHLILDVTQCQRAYQVGEPICFKLTYAGILSCMTSAYVSKHFR